MTAMQAGWELAGGASSQRRGSTGIALRSAASSQSATVRSGAYAAALVRRRPELEVVSLACPLFVPLVEEGWFDDPVTEAVARRYVEPLLEDGVDTLLLGCTHYPLLAPLLGRIAGDAVTLVDSAAAVSELVAEELALRSLLAAPADRASGGAIDDSPRDHYCVTDASARFARIARDFVGHEIRLELVDLAPSALAESTAPAAGRRTE